jgi:glycosyltransferase involved in cell wall biosynthesis
VRVLYAVTAYARHEADVITPWLHDVIHQLRPLGVHVEVLAPAYRGSSSHWVDGVFVHRFRYAPARLESLTHDRATPEKLREEPLGWGLVPGYVAAGAVATARLAGSFDLVHAFWPLPHGVFGLAARAARGAPYVCSYFGSELAVSRRFAPLVRWITDRSSGVIAISSHTARRLQRFVPGAAPTIIPLGPALTVPQEPLAYPEKLAKTLVFVGRLVERKGVSVLLDALALVAPDVHLTVVGDGPERPRLERQAAALGVGARVTFTGFVSGAEKAWRLREAHALVLPATTDARGDTEGLGVVLLEAMACGRPVIASRIGGITDIVEDGVHGWLVEPGDPSALAGAVTALFADPQRAGARGVLGHARVCTSFTTASVAARLVEVYRASVAA